MLSNNYTMICTRAHKSNFKIDDLLFEYTQSFSIVVKMVGRSVVKKVEGRTFIKARCKIGCSLNKKILKFLLCTDLLMILMTRFVDGKRNLILG